VESIKSPVNSVLAAVGLTLVSFGSSSTYINVSAGRLLTVNRNIFSEVTKEWKQRAQITSNIVNPGFEHMESIERA
jgi:hypothetical protein